MHRKVQTGGVVLCGGKSTRMGMPKAALPFGDEVLLQRVVRLLGQAVEPIVVVAAPGQVLAELPPGTILAHDRRPDRGPLEGLLAGIGRIAPQAEAAFATSCDVPLLSPAFVRRMVEMLDDYEIAVPKEGGFHHPLAGVYRTSVAAKIEELLEADRLRPVYLFEQCRTREVPVEELRSADAQLYTLMNCNRPEDYAAALAAAGLRMPHELALRLGMTDD